MTDILIEQFVIQSNTWNHFTTFKRMSLGSFKMYQKCVYKLYITMVDMP